jgi:hypothetical protein
MKRIVFIALSVLMLVSQEPADAAVKVGQVCKKLNQSTTISGKKLVCTKSGKLLVWKISPVISNKSGSESQQQRNPISLDNLDINQVYLAAAFAVNAKTTLSVNGVDVFQIYKDPKVDSEFTTRQTAYLVKANAYWKNIFNPKHVTVLYWDTFDDASIAWANSIYEPLRGNYNSRQPLSDCRSGNATAMNFLTESEDRNLIVVCSGREITTDKDFKLIHEYAHLAQIAQNIPGNAPHWVTEGGADYFGQVFGLLPQSKRLFNQHRSMLLRNARMNSNAPISRDDFVSEMRILEQPNGGDVQKAYYFGSLATEVLIAIYGVEKYETFMQQFRTLPNPLLSPVRAPYSFDEFFRTSFGVSSEEFYQKLHAYVLNQFSVS